MTQSVKQIVTLGIAVASFGVAMGSQSVQGQASGHATIVSNVTLKTDGYNRNMVATGKNALYSKPGTVAGAHLVASKAQMQKLATSSKSTDYFRAYRVAQTNRGSVYYKVVSMDGRYRGYVYGGRDADVFAGGIARTKTTKKAALPSKLAHFKLADIKKNTLWVAPKYTQYKSEKLNMDGVTADTLFTVVGAETKVREGSLYYDVVASTPNGPIDGWIYAGPGYQGNVAAFGGLKADPTEAAPSADNSVVVVYQDNGQNVSWPVTFMPTTLHPQAGQVVTGNDATYEDLEMFIANHVPTGYRLVTKVTDTTSARYGQTFKVAIQKIK